MKPGITTRPAASVPGAGRTLARGVWLFSAEMVAIATSLCSLAEGTLQTRRQPRLYPDYAGIVIPPNIAPLNFLVQEPGMRYRVRVWAPQGQPIETASKSPAIELPPKEWSRVLRANAGGPIHVDVAVLDVSGQWATFDTITNTIAPEQIDHYLVYRRLRPLYNTYREIGIYQRDLQSWEEWPVLENRSIGKGCLNCHTFLKNSTDQMALHIRRQGSANPMLLVRSNKVAHVAKTCGYLSWHPSGRLIAFSANKLSLFFHTIGETRDVFDADSDLGIYRVDSNVVVNPPALAQPGRLETWPSWAPDGRTLYFCSAPKLDKKRFKEVRYDLMSVSYDIERDSWGQPETVISADKTGLSAGQPRVSPDGRFLVYCLYAYGNFPIYQPTSDLHVIDPSTGESRRLEINSDLADTWHSWSSNSRWLVFSSKRRDGLFARPYFSYVDRSGRFWKPFLLPQKEPAYFDSCLQTINLPELVQQPVSAKPADFARAALEPIAALKPQVVSTQQAASPPAVPENVDAHSDQDDTSAGNAPK